jgi:hypothetical protein
MKGSVSWADSAIPAEVRSKYEFHNYGHALEILHMACVEEWGDVLAALRQFQIKRSDIFAAGGSESAIPKKFSNILFPRGWQEIKFSGDLHVRVYQRAGGLIEEKIITKYIDGHNIDYVKGKIAFDLEWNSKDQTFDRDILAMRTFFECGLIDAGVIVTRAEDLNDIFRQLNVISKYGASTTWMGKLTPRLNSRRQGGCPVLAIGIKKECVVG